jgi:hypothetical protein
MIDIDEACFVKNAIMKVIWQKNVNFYIELVTSVEDKGMKPMIVHWRNYGQYVIKDIPFNVVQLEALVEHVIQEQNFR